MSDALVSIGLPVYNGERYLRECLDCLLAQNYENTEIIISDNASTDSTQFICEHYAQRDSRIKYYRQPVNRGAAYNFEFVFEKSVGQYFMWAAHDDWFASTFISKCVKRLEEEPDAGMCVTDIIFIDESGQEILDQVYETFETIGMKPLEKIERIMSKLGWYDMYGLYRPEIIKTKKTDFHRFGADVTFTLEVILTSNYVKVNEPLFYYRRVHKSIQDYIEMSRTSFLLDKRPYTGLIRDLYRVVQDTNLTNQEKEMAEEIFLSNMESRKVGWRRVLVRENSSVDQGIMFDGWSRSVFKQLLDPTFEIMNVEVELQNYKLTNKIAQLKDRPIYIWGTGSMGLELAVTLSKNQIYYNGFIDSDSKKNGSFYFEKEVFLPSYLNEFGKNSGLDKPFILIGSMFEDEIISVLLTKGFKPGIDFTTVVL